MAEKSPKTVSFMVGAITNEILPVWKNTSGFGDITVLSAEIVTDAAGTAGIYLVNAGTDGGLTTGGTIASPSGTAYAAGTPYSMTMASSPVLSEGQYLGVQENNTGTAGTVTIVTITYLYGL